MIEFGNGVSSSAGYSPAFLALIGGNPGDREFFLSLPEEAQRTILRESRDSPEAFHERLREWKLKE